MEPIGISIKDNRGGLGREAVIEEIKAKKAEIRRKNLEKRMRAQSSQQSVEEYRLELP